VGMRFNKAGELRTDYHIIYDRLQPILEALGDKDFVKLESKGFMPLSVDRLYCEKSGAIRISIAHNYIQNGDVMADPDMEIQVYSDRKMAEAMTYQQDGLGIYQQVYFVKDGQQMVYPKLKKDLNHFLKLWLRNLKRQGFFEPGAIAVEPVEVIDDVEVAILMEKGGMGHEHILHP